MKLLYLPVSYTHLDVYKRQELQLDDLRKRLKDRQLDVKLTDAAKNYIVDEGYDPIYGARPLKRFLQRKVETLIGRMIIADLVHPNSTIIVDYNGGELAIKEERKEN